jgi:hypothetical protein
MKEVAIIVGNKNLLCLTKELQTRWKFVSIVHTRTVYFCMAPISNNSKHEFVTFDLNEVYN